jgi:replicative superfamily II helicase
MVDFGKRFGGKEIKKKINPIEIYDTLDRKNIAGPLRTTQYKILNAWFNEQKNKKDLIIKLHTGEGKTLIGLLILQSSINEYGEPCIYLCPNNNLVKQTCQEAIKFGIPYCTIGEDRVLPDDFLDGKKILITNANKLFNGKSKFGIQNNFEKIKTIILDDSHACIDTIRSTFTITIPSEHILYTNLRLLFEDYIREQGEGSYLELKDGNFNTILPISYWAWNEKKEEVLGQLSQNKDEQFIVFAWPLLKDKLENCQAFISGSYIQISPYFLPIHQFGSFNNAAQRILMSATTQDDSFFIKGLGFTVDSVANPLINKEQKWSGEKMILIPSLIHDDLDRVNMANRIARMKLGKFGAVVLTSSSRVADYYGLNGAIVAGGKIDSVIDDLKKGVFSAPVVLANRYDGIDLPDEACRILTIDSLPFFNLLADQYEEGCRLHSEITNIKYAQKIEQGLGRAVRGEKDYCAVILLGGDLVSFIKGSRTNKFFSAQTRKQIEIGLEIVKFAREEIIDEEAPGIIINSLLAQLINRDNKWKEFYAEQMSTIEFDEVDKTNFYRALELERQAEYECYIGNYESACKKMQVIIDNHCSDDAEKGWFLQHLARYKSYISVAESNNVQKSAYQNNLQLLKPKEGISYKKLDFIDGNRIRKIRYNIEKFNDFNDLMLYVEGVLSDLSFGIQAEKFEAALQNLGTLLGFESQRPDKEYKKGPDNLWCGTGKKYIFFECKNSVDDDRQEISKYEAGQMNNHCGWFDKEYGSEENILRILVIPTKTLTYSGNFTHDVRIMRKGKLKLLKDNIRGFIKEMKSYKLDSISDEKLQEFLVLHKLQIEKFGENYTESYVHKGH